MYVNLLIAINSIFTIMYTVYGIPNCNTVKKAIDWLKGNRVDYEFYDYKKKSITEDQLKIWFEQVGWEALLNKKGTTWRDLSETVKATIVNEEAAIALMKDKTSVLKRPIITNNSKILAVGFDEAVYKDVLSR